ncbi:MAG: Rieske (2Fe-2S) protein [Verrucomicrobia bacterium]|nr:Rieske (2Fe-2S) protein [Verrucomicrobiota bacterium]
MNLKRPESRLEACPTLMQRRRILKMFAVTTAYSKLLQTDWFGTLLAEVAVRPRPAVGILRLNLGDFPALRNDFGSVRIGTSRLSANVPLGLFYPIVINRAPGNQFFALNSECTHAGCAVPAFNRSSNSSACPCHGSRFGIDGRVINGPASFPLQQYKVGFDAAGTLTIEIPDWPHEVVGSRVEGSGALKPRFRLKFLAFANLEFEVLFRASLAAGWNPIPFSLTPDGPADRTVFAGNDDFTEVYVERATDVGFYAVAIRIEQV